MPRPKVILFDVNETLLDLTPVKASVGMALGGRPELAPVFGVRQFSALATIRNPSVYLVGANSGSCTAGVFAPFAVSNR